ncbi:spermidine/putrescine ABC transporter permease (plasmid) [Neorhizobium sp. NCHU2750]|nr:spermidine/putrescine ABC transporter permease [Neorhizobium sp. NCHU2750]
MHQASRLLPEETKCGLFSMAGWVTKLIYDENREQVCGSKQIQSQTRKLKNMADVATTGPGEIALRKRRSLDVFWFAGPGIVFLVGLFLIPTLQMLSVSFYAKTGNFDLSAFGRLFVSTVYLRVMATTFLVAIEVTILCLLLGYPLAYWLSSRKPRTQRISLTFILIPFWTSPIVLNFSWLVLLGRSGLVSKVAYVFGYNDGVDLLFNRGMVIFAMVHTMTPLTIVTLLPIMNKIDPRLAMAARTLGASGPQAFWQIYLPLSMRGVATACLLTFISSLGFFITPAIVGGRQDTMITQIIIQQINQLQNWQMGSALAVVLVLGSLIAIFIYDRLFGLSAISGGEAHNKADSCKRLIAVLSTRCLGSFFAAIGSVYERTFKGLRGHRLLSVYCWLIICLLLFPIVAFIPMAFTTSDFMSFPPPGYGFKWFNEYGNSTLWVSATIRSVGIGVASASLTLVIGAFAAFAIARSANKLVGITFLLFVMPMIVPPIVIAIAMFYLFAKLQLVATDISIIVGHTVISLPTVFVFLLATFKAHDWRLDQVASTLGASRIQTALRITLPLMRGGLAVGFITGFLHSFQELTVAMFLGGGLKTTLPLQMWNNIVLQVTPTLAAASVVVLGVTILMFVAIELLQPRRSGEGSR